MRPLTSGSPGERNSRDRRVPMDSAIVTDSRWPSSAASAGSACGRWWCRSRRVAILRPSALRRRTRRRAGRGRSASCSTTRSKVTARGESSVSVAGPRRVRRRPVRVERPVERVRRPGASDGSHRRGDRRPAREVGPVDRVDRACNPRKGGHVGRAMSPRRSGGTFSSSWQFRPTDFS